MRCYHGLGDTIQFARYLPLLAERAALVRVEAQPELIPLLRSLPGNVDLVPLGDQEHPPARFGCDAEIDITELPHAFRTTLGTIPAAIPYLSVEPERSEEAARRLSAVPGRLRVGLVWAAGAWRPERSVPLDRLARLAEIPGVALVNLQRGPEYRSWRETPGLAADDRGVRQRRDRGYRRDDRQSRSGRSRWIRWSRISPARSAPRYG